MDPVILHAATADDVGLVAPEMPAYARMLAVRFWPGPLTLVLPKREIVPDVATAGLPSVAIRIPSHPVAQALIRAAGVPIAAPSANMFMRTSATNAQHVVDDLGERVDLILDGGPTQHGIESTVVSVADGEVRLLRPGAVTPEALAEALASVDPPIHSLFGAVGATASPGMLAKHYLTHGVVVPRSGEGGVARHQLRHGKTLQHGRAYLLLADEDADDAAEFADSLPIVYLGSECDLDRVRVVCSAPRASSTSAGQWSSTPARLAPTDGPRHHGSPDASGSSRSDDATDNQQA